MAITAANVYSGAASTNGSQKSTGSISWTAGCGYLCLAQIDNANGGSALTAPDSVAGITWTLLQSWEYNPTSSVAYYLWGGIASSTTSAALNINWNTVFGNCYAVVDEFSGIAASSVFVQSSQKQTPTPSGTTISGTALSAFGNASNATWVAATSSTTQTGTTFAVESGYTTLRASANTPTNFALITGYVASNDTTPTMTVKSGYSGNAWLVAVEIKASAGSTKLLSTTVASTAGYTAAESRSRKVVPGSVDSTTGYTVVLTKAHYNYFTGSVDYVETYTPSISLVLSMAATVAEAQSYTVALSRYSETHLDTGLVLPTVGSTSGGTVAWTNPGNITASDNTYATQVSSGTASSNGYLQATEFGFSIPGGSLIYGVDVQIERSRTGGSVGEVVDDTVQLLKAGVANGSNYAVSSNWAITDEVITYGGSSDQWGYAWTRDDINDANFGIQLRAVQSPGKNGQGEFYPTAAAQVAGTNGLAWLFPTNAEAHDTAYTTCTAPGALSTTASLFPFLNLTAFGFSVPTGSTITSIIVRSRGKQAGGTSGGMRYQTVQLTKAGSRVGTNKGSTFATFPTTEGDQYFGATTGDLWGTTWTPAEVNDSSFGVSIRAIGTTADTAWTAYINEVTIEVFFNQPGDRTARVDSVTVRVHYGPDLTQKTFITTIAEVAALTSVAKLFRTIGTTETQTQAYTTQIRRAIKVIPGSIDGIEQFANITLARAKFLATTYGGIEALSSTMSRVIGAKPTLSETESFTSALQRVRKVLMTSNEVETFSAAIGNYTFLVAAINEVQSWSTSLTRSLLLSSLISEVESLNATISRVRNISFTEAQQEVITNVLKRARSIAAQNSEVEAINNLMSRSRSIGMTSAETETITSALLVGHIRLLSAAIIETLNTTIDGVTRVRGLVTLLPEAESYVAAVQRARNMGTVVAENGTVVAQIQRHRAVITEIVENSGINAGVLRRLFALATDIAETAGITVRVSIYAQNPTTIHFVLSYDQWVQQADGTMALQTINTSSFNTSILSENNVIDLPIGETYTIEVEPSYSNV